MELFLIFKGSRIMDFKYEMVLTRNTNIHNSEFIISFLFFFFFKATTFLEQWKRLQMRLSYFWDLTGLEEEEVSFISLS